MQKLIRKPIPKANDHVIGHREKQERLLDSFWNHVVDQISDPNMTWPARFDIDSDLERDTLSPFLISLRIEGWKAEIFVGPSHDPDYALVISPDTTA